MGPRANHGFRDRRRCRVSRSEIVSHGDPAKAALTRWRLDDVLSLAGPYLGLLLVVALFSLLIWWARDRVGEAGLELFLSLDNLKLVTVQAAITAAVALGMTIIMISGGIDLSVGYVVSL